MKRLCPACFTELAEEANYCPVCGKCMREPVEQSSQYVGGVPVTTVIKMNDCAIHIGVSGIGLEENKYKPQEVSKVAETIERKPFKSIHIDTEKGIYLLNGEEVQMISRIDLEFNNGKWSLLITRDELYAQETTKEDWNK